MARPAAAARPHKVKGFWCLVRRVPVVYEAIDSRDQVRLTTGIRVADDPRGIRAAEVVGRLDRELHAYWRDKRNGRDPGVKRRYDEACGCARLFGIDYSPAPTVAAEATIEDILRRFEVLLRRGTASKPGEVAALLGGEAAPAITAGGMLEEYEAIVRASLVSKSERQRKKWRVPRELAIRVLAEAVGDRPLASLTRADALKLRTHWQDRVVAGEVAIRTANKIMGHAATMFRAINETRQLNLPPIFERVRIGGGKMGQRLAFAPAFVQSRILAEGMFDDLNPEALRIIYLLAETGLRLSEAVNLTRATIHLDAPVPHVSVEPEGRDLKTVQSRREIPLVGVALMAMREQPDGFPRYHERADTLSALVKKAMDARGLRPEAGQSLYSLRHTFEDRLAAVDPPEKIIACLMGHTWSRPRYGVGPSLEHKREWLARIAFKPPSRV